MNTFYVTTAIPYATTPPHIGNALDYILADSLSRYHQKQKDAVYFSTGADEHGQKVAQKAADANITPQKYTDAMDVIFKQFAKTLGVEYSYWLRTTEPKHIKGAQALWKQLEPYIYKKQYTGLYCVGCERFVTEKEARAEKGICPDHKKAYTTISEENYFFKLSDFGDKIKEALESGTFKIVPETRRNEVISLINDGLEDISISRDASRMSWGIPVPGDKTHVMYVWFEALMNYITTLDYPNGENFKTFWPADVQIIGKDIIRFHAVIWPAMLLAMNLPLPRQLFVHGHIQAGNQKMSKTIGNVIEPKQIVESYGLDAFRYFFLRHIPSQEDGDFTWEKFEAAYNNELGNELGNLVQRLAAMINRYQDGVIGTIPGPEHDIAPYNDAMTALRIDQALDYVWTLIRGLNQYLEEEKPWEIAKQQDPEHLQEVLAYGVSSLMQIADLLSPFLPGTSKVITEIFEKGLVKQYHGVLFPRIYNYSEAPTKR
ncbi:MAG TPA: methionine--tRNA ligase [Candidatus Saccharimonadales bacterium]|nr:methionine--tRNA ligase [Candidatus Saccharimonadales bacterium]